MIVPFEVAEEGPADLVPGHGAGRIPEPRLIDERGAGDPTRGSRRTAR